MVNLCSSSHAYRDLFFALATFFVATFTACAQGQEQERTAPPALPTQPLPQVPKPSIPPLAQAQELTNRGAYDEAAALYRQIIHSQPSAVAAYEGLAYSLLKNDQLRQAAQACSSGLRYDSTSVALYNLLSAAYAGQGRHALAISALERAVTQRPTYAQGLANLGGLHTRLGHYKEAEPYFKAALLLGNDDPILYRRYGELLLQTGHADSARALFERALKNDNDSETLHFLIGKSSEEQGAMESALSSYDRARQLDPSFVDAHYRTALLARRLNRQDLATEALAAYANLQKIGAEDPLKLRELKKMRASIADTPEEPQHHFRLALFLARNNFPEMALNRFRRVLQFNAQDFRAHNHIGNIYLARQDPTSAKDHFVEALRGHPNFVPALLNAGNTSMLLDDPTAARSYYSRAAQLVPQAAIVWLQLARTQLALGQRNLAIQSLQKGLAISSAPPDVHRALRDLLHSAQASYQ
jgi:tetratricopeptide (TPR) repeat protein